MRDGESREVAEITECFAVRTYEIGGIAEYFAANNV
jgi:hypothetical protein